MIRNGLFSIALTAAISACNAAEGTTSTQKPLKAAFSRIPRQALPPLTIYTSQNAPSTPALETLEKRKSMTQYGITWTFDKEVPVGQFISGDWYVVGPVTVVAIDPKPLFGSEVAEEPIDKVVVKESKYPGRRARHGSMLNPPRVPRPGHYYDAGFDSRLPDGRYDPELFAKLPVAMKPGDMLLSTISRRNDEITEYVGQHVDAIRACALLACMKEPQPADAFRVSYCDTANSKVYLARHLRRELLLRLPKMPGVPASLGDYAACFQRPWQDLCDYSISSPLENMPHYGQTINELLGEAALLLQMDYAPQEKERLLVNMVQVGIDFWGQVRHGYSWIADGGINQGRKFPIVFAGLMLDDEQMQHPKKHYPKCRFEEDDQTAMCPYTYKGKVYDTCWTGARAFYVGHSPWDVLPGEGPPGEWEKGWGPLELFHPKDWPLPGKPVLGSDGYRVSNSSPAWVGIALAMRLMHIEKVWHHDAFFPYVDRWMTEDDAAQAQALKDCGREDRTKRKFGDWGRQGYISNIQKAPWIAEMWKKYRNNLPPGDDGQKTPPAEVTWK